MLLWLLEQLKLTDAEIASHNRPEEGESPVLQHYPVPLHDARISALWSFDTKFQRQLSSIKRQLGFLDDNVDRSRMYFDLSFAKLEGDNRNRALKNLDAALIQYAKGAQRVVNMIRALPTMSYFSVMCRNNRDARVDAIELRLTFASRSNDWLKVQASTAREQTLSADDLRRNGRAHAVPPEGLRELRPLTVGR